MMIILKIQGLGAGLRVAHVRILIQGNALFQYYFLIAYLFMLKKCIASCWADPRIS